MLVLQSAFGQAIYLPNPGSNTVSSYIMNPLTGTLTPVAGSPFLTGTTPVQALVHPNGKFLYVLDAGAQDITAYSISAPSGVLTNIPCPLCSAVFPTAMAITPAGDVLVVASATSSILTGYSVNSITGALTKGPSVPSGTGPVHLEFDPSGRYLYVANFASSQITGYAVGSGGFLTPVPGSPFPAGSGTRSVAVSSNAVFATNQYSADVYVYRIGSAGSLVQAGIPVPAGGSPSSIAVDPTASFIYVANGTQVVPFYNVPSSPYPITPVTPATADISPAIVAVEPSGRFVFVADSVTTTVSVFSIGANGTLLPLGDVSTFGTRGIGWMAANHIGDTTLISLSPGFPSPSGSAQFGATVEFRGKVADILNPGGIPKGSVSFQLNGAGTPIGTAALDSLGGFDFNFNGSTAFLPIGSFFMRILYNPGAGFEAPVPLDTAYAVTQAAPSFTIGYSPAAPVATQSMTINISSQQAGGRFPSGPVSISVDATQVGSVTLINGSASISYVPTTGDHSISVSYRGDSFFLAARPAPLSFHVKHPTTTVLTSNSATPVYGEMPVFTAMVASDGFISGSVDFFDGTTDLGTATVVTSGSVYTAQLSTYRFTSLGQHFLTAVYSGDGNNLPSNNNAAPLTLNVSRDGITVSTPVASGTLQYGNPVTFTAGVAAASPGSGTPTGNLTFQEGATSLGSPKLASGSAAFTTSTLPAGQHTITASYPGDVNFLSGASVAGLLVTIAQATPLVTVSTTPSSASVSGQQITISASLSQTPAATGSIDFNINGAKIGSAVLTNNLASLSYTPATAGSYSISVNYKGDSNNAASSGGITLTVSQAAVNVSTPSASGALVVGQSLTLTSTVSAAAPGSGNPTGNITFTEGGSTVGVAPLVLGTANLTTSSLSVGNHSITATYSGDANFAAGSSRITSVVVDRATPVLAITVDPPSALISGQAVIINMTLSGIAGAPFTGSMTLTDSGTAVTASPLPVTSGQAQFGPYVLAGSGSHLLGATYSGDVIYKPLTSTSTIAVNRAAVIVHASSSSSVTPYQKQVSLSATVSATPPGSGLPTGIVSWIEGNTVIGSAALAGGVATLTTSSLAVGDHALVLAYQGDANFLPDSSAKASITVVKAVSSLSLAASPVSGLIAGQTVTLTVSVSNATGATGSLNFWDETGAINANPVPLSQGTAVVPYTPATAGVHTIVVQYSGDGNYMAADNRSSPLALTVKPASALVSTPAMIGTTQVGQPLTLVSSVSVAQPGSGSPTGVVAFQDGKVALGTASLVGGSATITLGSLLAGPHSVTASYAGDPNFSAANSSTLVFSENRGITSTAVSAQQNATSTILSAYVRAIGGSAPTGYAQFLNGATSLGTVALTPVDQTSSIGTLSVPTVSGVITASYLGDGNFNGSASAAITLSPTAKLPVTIGISSSLAVIGQPVGLTAVLSWTGGGTPTGTIQFFEGQTLLATVPAKATSTLNISLSAGLHNIVGVYSGDSSYSPASINYVLQVSKNIPALSLSVDQTSIVAGQAAVFTINLTPQGPAGAPFPTGPLQLTEAGAILGSAAINHGAATITLTALSPGVHLISGAYPGDDSWGAVLSNPLSVTVSKAATATGMHTTADSTESADIDVEAMVSVIAPGAGTPTGMVQFIDSATNQVLGSAQLIGGVATATIPATSVTAAIIATYSGDARFTGSSSAPAAQFAILNSASFQTSILAPDEIVTIFGAGLSNVTTSAQFPLPYSLGGVALTLTDSSGLGRPALLLYVSPGQLSFIVPGESTPGPATLQIAAANGSIYSVAVTVASVSPGLFTANSTGKGAAAAQTIRVHPDGSQDPPQTVAAYDSVTQTWRPAPIDMGSAGDSSFLILYGTGIRHGTSLPTVTIGGQTLVPLYSGTQGTFPGLDQINVQIPASLAGSGLVTVTVMIDGQSSNSATLYFK